MKEAHEVEFVRAVLHVALFAAWILGLGMTGCGGGTVAFLWVLGQQYNQIAALQGRRLYGQPDPDPAPSRSPRGTASSRWMHGGQARRTLRVRAEPGHRRRPGRAYATGGNISLFSVGGDGVLTFQQSLSVAGLQLASTSRWMCTGSYAVRPRSVLAVQATATAQSRLSPSDSATSGRLIAHQ